MSIRLGLLAPNAKTVDVRQRGSVTIMDVEARGLTKRAAKRGARKEASSLVPVTRQNFINATELSTKGLGSKYLFTISDNGD